MSGESANLMLLTPLELDIMRVLWRSPEAMPVRAVQLALRPRRTLAYTSVMTTLGRMYQKGLLHRQNRGRAHCYTSALTYAEARDSALKHLVRSFFDSSEDQLREFLSGEPIADIVTAGPVMADPGPSAIDEILL